MRKMFTFSVDDKKDIDIIKHLQKCTNKSQYIKELIRNDMLKSSAFSSTQREEIENIVRIMLKDFNLSEKTDEVKKIDKDILDALDQF